MKKEVVKFVLAIVFCVLFVASSQAATREWLNPGPDANNHAWNVAGNWNTGIPIAGDTAVTRVAKECIIGTDMVGAAKAIGAGTSLLPGVGIHSFLTIKGELAITGNFMVGQSTANIAGALGTVRIDPGAVVTTGVTYIGYAGDAGYTQIGDINVMGGTYTTTAMAFGSSGTGYGKLALNGGTTTVTSASHIMVGLTATSKGKITVNNGAKLITTGTCGFYVGRVGTGELTINSGGYVKVAGNCQAGSTAGSTGSITMNGGTLEGFQLYAAAATGTAGNFIQLNNDANVTMSGALYIANGANTAGRLTIAGSAAKMKIGTGIYVGVTTGNGNGKIELQAGTLTGLSSLNVYTGASIDITGGTLILPISQLANVNTYVGDGRIYSSYGGSRCIKVTTTATQVIVTADINLLKTAWAPVPANGSTFAPCADANIVLQWSPGLNAVSHDVYVGAAYNDVNDANTSTTGIFQGNQPGTTFNFNPVDVNVGQTVYWRIDEVNSPTTTKGAVWSFIRGAVSDTFESYTNDAALQAVWTNGKLQIGSTTYVPLGTSPAGGRGASIKSMEVDYSTASSPYESKVTQTFSCPRSFANGAKSIVCYFQADKGNAPEVLFIELSDGTNTAKVYRNSGNTQDVNDYAKYWQFFGCKLSDFAAAGVNLSSVTSISIGAGDGIAGGGGTGKFYIDDLSVYQSSCFGEITLGMGDIAADCTINFSDFSTLARDWHQSGSTVTAVAPSDSNLVLWYAFEAGEGSTAADSSANMNDGTITPGDAIWGVPGINGGTALLHNGGIYVTLPSTAFSTITTQMTISGWVRNPCGSVGTNINHWFDGGKSATVQVFCTYIGWKPEMDSSLTGTLVFLTNAWVPGVPQDGIIIPATLESLADQWNHWAITADTVTGVDRMYLNGVLLAEAQNAFQPIADMTRGTLGAALAGTSSYFLGDTDEFKLYNRALSQEEVVSLANKASVFQPLLTTADINKDNVVDFKDLSVMLDNWASLLLWP
ncbi:MAG: LamG domain-containing protein [Phycisphaerae bacterium]